MVVKVLTRVTKEWTPFENVLCKYHLSSDRCGGGYVFTQKTKETILKFVKTRTWGLGNSSRINRYISFLVWSDSCKDKAWEHFIIGLDVAILDIKDWKNAIYRKYINENIFRITCSTQPAQIHISLVDILFYSLSTGYLKTENISGLRIFCG